RAGRVRARAGALRRTNRAAAAARRGGSRIQSGGSGGPLRRETARHFAQALARYAYCVARGWFCPTTLRQPRRIFGCVLEDVRGRGDSSAQVARARARAVRTPGAYWLAHAY